LATNHTALSACQKIEFLQQVRQHLMLSPEEYRLLVVHILREHRNEQAERTRESVRQAA
jgi:hypothetical protein